jgi:hypothetical protein
MSFPVLSFLLISVELIDAKYIDTSLLVEIKVPITGNLDKPGFESATFPGLQFDTESDEKFNKSSGKTTHGGKMATTITVSKKAFN